MNKSRFAVAAAAALAAVSASSAARASILTYAETITITGFALGNSSLFKVGDTGRVVETFDLGNPDTDTVIASDGSVNVTNNSTVVAPIGSAHVTIGAYDFSVAGTQPNSTNLTYDASTATLGTAYNGDDTSSLGTQITGIANLNPLIDLPVLGINGLGGFYDSGNNVAAFFSITNLQITNSSSISSVPLPPAGVLFGAALVAVAGLGALKSRKLPENNLV